MNYIEDYVDLNLYLDNSVRIQTKIKRCDIINKNYK